MPDRLLHRTWSIRTVSPFVRTLRIGGPSPLPLAAGGDDAVGSIGAVSGGAGTNTNANTDAASASASAQASRQSADANISSSNSNTSSNSSSQECRWYPTLSELAEEITNRLRACPDLVDSSTTNNTSNTASGGGGGSSASASALGYGGLSAIPTDPMLLLGGDSAGGGSGMLEIGGTYAALTWIDLDEAAMRRGRDDDIDAMDITTTSGGSPATTGGGAGGAFGRKRSRRSSGSSNGRGGANSSSQKHLHVEVRINDEPAAQILLCSAEVATSATAAAAAATSSTLSSSASASAAAAAANDPAFLSPIHSQYYSHHEPVHVHSFSYLLLRGKMKAIQPVLLYLESTLGCAIGTRPFTPSPADVAASLSNWMVGTVVEQRRQRRRLVAEYRGRKSIGSGSGGNGGNGMDDDIMGIGGMGSIMPGGSTVASKKPLELTLAIPPHLVRAGLERITVTVPPVSLTRLCSAVERKRPVPSSTPIVGKGGSRSSGAITPLMVTDSEKDDESSGYRPGNGLAVGTAAAAASNANGSTSGTDQQLKSPDNNDQHTEQVDHDEDLPILRALQCYLYEAFHIDARQLHVVKAATAHAVVGTDGRIKPLTVEALPSLLDDIGMMIRRATGARTESFGAEADES